MAQLLNRQPLICTAGKYNCRAYTFGKLPSGIHGRAFPLLPTSSQSLYGRLYVSTVDARQLVGKHAIQPLVRHELPRVSRSEICCLIGFLNPLETYPVEDLLLDSFFKPIGKHIRSGICCMTVF
jgi:hypothetical protein